MNQNVIYVGIDVDDLRYHGSAVDKHAGFGQSVEKSGQHLGPGTVLAGASDRRLTHCVWPRRKVEELHKRACRKRQ